MNNNKFSNSNISKFGFQHINSSTGLTPTMEAGLNTAIPIWELLRITEEQYDSKYKTPILDISNCTIEETKNKD